MISKGGGQKTICDDYTKRACSDYVIKSQKSPCPR